MNALTPVVNTENNAISTTDAALADTYTNNTTLDLSAPTTAQDNLKDAANATPVYVPELAYNETNLADFNKS